MSSTNLTASNNQDDLPLIEEPASLAAERQGDSRLMKLPAELRLMILREVLVANKPLSARSTYTAPIALNGGPRRDKNGRFRPPEIAQGEAENRPRLSALTSNIGGLSEPFTRRLYNTI